MKPCALIILDGFGLSGSDYGNAVRAANTPNLDRYMSHWPTTQLGASGMDVGLPNGQMGNSEVGHTNIGAGRVVYQELTRITKSIEDGDFYENDALVAAVDNCKRMNTALHIMGLLGDGGVHSHQDHLYALLELCKRKGLDRVYVHCFMDGRDTPPHAGAEYLRQLEAKMTEIGVGRVATVSGRYYAMDRDNRWERVQKAFDAVVKGEGPAISPAARVLEESYEAGVTDEFVVPAVCVQGAAMQDDDSVICLNFRPDRVREITRTLVDPEFSGFDRGEHLPRVHYVCMTQYDATMPNVHVAFHPQSLQNTLGDYLAQQGKKQLRIAETEKYAHVTFFFNGGVETPFEGEDRALIPSPKVATYDLKPEMSAFEVTDEVLRRLDSGVYDVIILNYANCDMVGHTGVLDAAVKAVEAVDECLGRVVDKIITMGGCALITADHGNADVMMEPDGSPFTAHTTNPVPFVLAGVSGVKLLPPGEGRLCDLAPTMLRIMELPKPQEMTGRSIIV